jgi:hypothetical protein
VYGFDTFSGTGSGLRVVVGEDTLVYPLSEVFSSIATEPPMMAPAGVTPVRAFTGSAVGFSVDFAIDPVALARARLRLPVDASLAEVGPFVRPIPTRSILYGIRVGGDPERLALAELQYADGELAVNDTGVLTSLVQRTLISPETAFDRFEVASPRSTASLDILPILLPASGAEALPRFTLTVVGGTD